MTLFLDKDFQLLAPFLLGLNDLLSLPMDSVISFEFFLQLYDLLVSLVKPRGQSSHDISVFVQDVFVPIDL